MLKTFRDGHQCHLSSISYLYHIITTGYLPVL